MDMQSPSPPISHIIPFLLCITNSLRRSKSSFSYFLTENNLVILVTSSPMMNISSAWGRDSSSPQSRLSEYFLREIPAHTTKIKDVYPVTDSPMVLKHSSSASPNGRKQKDLSWNGGSRNWFTQDPSIPMRFWQSDTSLPAVPTCQGPSTHVFVYGRVLMTSVDIPSWRHTHGALPVNF